MSVGHVPDGYHSVTPYLIVTDPAGAIDFYGRAFGATETMRLTMPGGGIAHAEVRIGDSPVMLAGEWPEYGSLSPESRGGTPVGLCVYLADSDAAVERAVAAGARLERPVTDQFYGDRSGTVIDPYGHKWTLSTRKENLTPAQMQRRMEEWMQTGAE